MRKREPRQSDRGVVAAVAALLIPMVLGAFLGLTFNMGLLLGARGQLQDAADAAALAAAGDLGGRPGELWRAELSAEVTAGKHMLRGGAPITIVAANGDVQFGRWHFRSEPCLWSGVPNCPRFEEATDPASQLMGITAVRVIDGADKRSGPTDGHNPPIQPLFGGFVGATSTIDISAASVATSPAARSRHSMPFALPACVLMDAGGSLACGLPRVLKYSPSPTTDAIGIIDIDDVSDDVPSVDQIAAMILARGTGAVHDTGGGYRVENGEEITLNDTNDDVLGALLGFARNAGGGYTMVQPGGGGTSQKCVLGRRVSFAVIDDACPGPLFNGDPPVLRFAEQLILELSDRTGRRYCDCPTVWPSPPPTVCPSGPTYTDRSMTIEVTCDGNGLATDPNRVRLVR